MSQDETFRSSRVSYSLQGERVQTCTHGTPTENSWLYSSLILFDPSKTLRLQGPTSLIMDKADNQLAFDSPFLGEMDVSTDDEHGAATGDPAHVMSALSSPQALSLLPNEICIIEPSLSMPWHHPSALVRRSAIAGPVANRSWVSVSRVHLPALASAATLLTIWRRHPFLPYKRICFER